MPNEIVVTARCYCEIAVIDARHVTVNLHKTRTRLRICLPVQIMQQYLHRGYLYLFISKSTDSSKSDVQNDQETFVCPDNHRVAI
jgi:hypothetical protein